MQKGMSALPPKKRGDVSYDVKKLLTPVCPGEDDYRGQSERYYDG